MSEHDVEPWDIQVDKDLKAIDWISGHMDFEAFEWQKDAIRYALARPLHGPVLPRSNVIRLEMTDA